MKWFLFILLFLAPWVAWASEPADKAPLDYSLDVSFDKAASTITGVARIPLVKGQELRLRVGALRITGVTLDGRQMAFPLRSEVLVIVPEQAGTVEIRYEGVFGETSDRDEESGSVIGERGIFLSGVWYPKPEEMCTYHLTARLPQGFEAVSEAETIEKTTEGSTVLFSFAFPHPVDHLTFVATDRFEVVKEHFGNVEIYAYFFREDADLVETYLAQTKRYLGLYTTLIGPFPYTRFSVVENFLPTGYSMPTYTLLGQQVVRLPFIPQTSLGHEILHQWFGNLVYIDYEKGNWAEGLTSFLADHYYEAEKGLGAEYRKAALIGYMSYVNDKNEFPLKDFRMRSDQASEAIGYGKATMVFQMLKTMGGDDRFYESLRYFVDQMHFRKASWEDIRKAFEKYQMEDLGWFFRRWIDEKGLAEVTVSNVEMKPAGATYEVAFDLRQDRKSALDVPVSLYFEGGKIRKVVRLSQDKERFSMASEGLPDRIVLDEDYEVARRLSGDEFPPVIARLLGDDKRIVVASPSNEGTYSTISDSFRERGDRVVRSDQVTHSDVKANSLVILGADNPLARGLFGSYRGENGFTVTVRENPWNPQKVAAVFDSTSKKEADLGFPKIVRYGKFSILAFDEGRNMVKKTDETAQGIARVVAETGVGVDVSTLTSLPAIMERAAGKKIIYVGEAHDRFSNHIMELEVIKDLHRRGKKIAIGMEMFQRPFQKVLDDYVAGRIDEKEFLKGSEYFTRWAFDYSLYRPILLFARSEKIPVVALNQKREIVDKVFRNGLESLSEDEKKTIPQDMDFTDEAYRERLKRVFHRHEGLQPDRFDFFYQAQVLWDETMAESVDLFLKIDESYQMVVLAGQGHIAYGSGIPKRTVRRNGYEYSTILVDADLETGVADFVLFPGTMPGGRAPLLQVQLKESSGKVSIEDFPESSVSKKAGMKVGDTILSVNAVPIHAVEDLKIELLSRTKGDKARIRVLRKGFFGTREIDFDVILQ
jgi:aminopeptidase N